MRRLKTSGCAYVIGLKVKGSRRANRVTEIQGRLTDTRNIWFKHNPAASLNKSLRNLAVSTGSACSSHKAEASHVLLSLGLTEVEASCCLRISWGRPTSEAALMAAADELVSSVGKVRFSSPAWKYR